MAHQSFRAAKAHFALCIFGSPALVLRDFLTWILTFKSSCWILFFETCVNFSIYSAPKQGVPQIDTCCVRIQCFLCSESSACPFHLILSTHALEEAVNRELEDIFPVLALISPLLYPLSYLVLRPLASWSVLSC